MLTISHWTAMAEKAAHRYHDVNYLMKTNQRNSSIFQFRHQDYMSMKRWLQEGHFSFRDNVVLTDDDDVEWIPIEKPPQLAQDGEAKPTFFSDHIDNVSRYTFLPGRYASQLFLSALSCIAQYQSLLQRVVPHRLEQNCSDIYEMPGDDDEDESSNGSDSEDAPALEGDEGGQFSSYQSCTNGEADVEEESQVDRDNFEEPATYGLFSSSYKEKEKEKGKKSYKLGIWDSDTYSSSDEVSHQHPQQHLCPHIQTCYQYENVEQPEQQDANYYESIPATPSPSHQTPEPIAGPIIANKYAGIFRFRFWNNGQWVEVIVDELLPYSAEGDPLSSTAFDVSGRPVKDLWLPLFEKAYAKLLGRYECLSSSSGGCIEDFLTDLTGGMCETIHLRTSQHRNDFGLQASLGNRMHTEFYSNRKKKLSGGHFPGFYSLLCAIEENYDVNKQGELSEFGLIYGRAYPVTDVREVSFSQVEAFAPNNHSLLMVRLKDPFGPAAWNGPFSRGSPEWLAISPIERFKIGLICDTECDFWMPIDQFCSRFTQVTFCRIVNTTLFSVRRHYWDNSTEGSWRTAARMAGGSYESNRETFLRNPQYLFRVEPHHATVMISLSQQLIRQDPSQERHSIGFTLLHVEENRIFRVHHIPTPEPGFQPIVHTTPYKHTGPVFLKTLLYHGRYVIIPTTNEPMKNGNFILRLICRHQCFLRYLNQDIPARHLLMPYPTCVTRVRVIRASSLCRLDRPTGTINAYCMIWCERNWVRTKTLWHNTDPEWNQSAVFYRRWSATMCIKVVIWHQAPKLWRDQYLGKHIFQAYEETGRPITVCLYGRRRWENNQPRSGVLTVEITSCPDVGAF